MALTETRPETDEPPRTDDVRPAPGALERLFGSGDHVGIGRLFIGFSLAFSAISLLILTVCGIDTMTDNGFLADRATQLGASAEVALVLLGIVPLLLGLAVAIVPLQLGSPAISYPRAAALSFWTWLVCGGIFLTSTAIDGGVIGGDATAAKLGNVSMGAVMVALGLGAVCVATTVMTHRPLGLRLAWVPGLSWASLVGAAVLIVTLGAAFAHVVLGQVARMEANALGANFTDGLGWLLRGPTVYVFAIPVLGIAVDVVASATRRPFPRTDVVQLVIGLYAVLAFGAWAQLPGAVNTVMWTVFALAIAVPILGLIGAIGDAVRRGTATVSPAMILSLVSLLLLLGAVLAGLLRALDLAGQGTLFGLSATALDAAQTFFVASAALAGGLAGSMHWSPLLWGGPDGAASRLTMPLVVLGGALLSSAVLVQALVQLDGEDTAAQLFGAIEAAGAAVLALGVLNGLLTALRTADEAEEAEPVDGGLTLEWSFPAPASGGVELELARVTSPYPLLDAPEGDEEDV